MCLLGYEWNKLKKAICKEREKPKLKEIKVVEKFGIENKEI